jgi:hypothetical protein
MRHQPVQRVEFEFRESLTRPGASGYIGRLLERLRHGRRNELIAAATLLLSLDYATALFLLRLDDRVAPATLVAARERTRLFFQNAGDGTAAQLMLALSSGALSGGLTQDRDGSAPTGQCQACCSQ